MRYNQTVTVEKNIKTMFFFKQGMSRVECTFEKDCVALNEPAVINCKIDNRHCDKTIREIKVKVLR